MILKAFLSRHDMPIFDINEPISKAIDEQEEFMFIGGFHLIIDGEEDTDGDDDINSSIKGDAGDKIATVYGTFFDEDKILNEGQNIVDLADVIDSDIQGAMHFLSRSKLYKEDIDEDKSFLSLFSCYIERVYIYPKFRNKGIARYIFENLEQIFLHCFNTPIHSFVLIPKPQQPDEQGNWHDSLDEDGIMLKRMIDIIKKAGFRRLGKSEYFAKNCAAKS